MTIIVQAKRKFAAPPFVRTIDDPRDPLNLSLVGHWTMDAETINGTKMLDLSGRDNHGALVNAPPIVSGRIGQAIKVNGTSQYIAVPHNASLNVTTAAGLAISAWVYPTGSVSGNTEAIVAKSDGGSAFNYMFYRNHGALDVLGFWNGSNYIGSTVVIPLNTWTHVSYNTDGLNSLFVVNGVPVGAAIFEGVGPINTGPVAIGANPATPAPDSYFQGYIDDVRIYNRGLRNVELQRLYWNPARDRVPYQTRARIATVAGAPSSSITSRRTLRQRTGSRA